MLITERTGYKMSGDNEGLIVTPEPLQKMYPAGEESEEWEWWKPEAQQEWLSSGSASHLSASPATNQPTY